jgi:lipoate-protein ligase A
VRYFDVPIATPGMQLACDDLLLEACETDPTCETLRVWQPETHFVVTGYTNRIMQEVRVDACVERGIPLYRRTSGGGTVVQGPGSFNYALVLRMEREPDLATISATNAYILHRIANAIAPLLGSPVELRGHTDLVFNGRKFSGNAQRRKERALLFHGTMLIDFDFAVIEALLPLPSSQPEYRAGRSHTEFLTNIPLRANIITDALRNEWCADRPYGSFPLDAVRSLAESRYLNHDWTYRF